MDCCKPIHPMPHILLVCEYTTLNGGERSMLVTLPGLRKQGFRISVVTGSSGPLVEKLKGLDVRTRSFAFHDERGRRFPQSTLREGLARLVEYEAPQLVHANSVAMSRLLGPVMRIAGRPSLGHLRDIVKLSPTAIADLSCHNRLVAVSQATREWFVKAGIRPTKIHVTKNGVDLDVFKPRPQTGYLHRKLLLPSNALLMAAVGQIGLRKGFDIVLEAMRHVLKRHHNSHLIVVGERYSEKAESRRFAEQLRHRADTEALRGRVHFLGYRDDIHLVLPELTLLVHAARQEPYARVLIEGAATGIPIVATRVGGTTEIFPPNTHAACLVAPENPLETANAIDHLLSDSALRMAMGSAARRRAVENFGIAVATESLAGHYRELILSGIRKSP